MVVPMEGGSEPPGEGGVAVDHSTRNKSTSSSSSSTNNHSISNDSNSYHPGVPLVLLEAEVTIVLPVVIKVVGKGRGIAAVVLTTTTTSGVVVAGLAAAAVVVVAVGDRGGHSKAHPHTPISLVLALLPVVLVVVTTAAPPPTLVALTLPAVRGSSSRSKTRISQWG
jgi:hypothetical protein